eukprot:jgi/Ulvmu1/4989/UM021_0006.1
MFSFSQYNDTTDSFRSLLESSLTRGGPSGLAYVEANKYSLKQQLLEVHEDPRFGNLKLKEVDHHGDRRRRIYALEGTIPISHTNGKFNIPIEVLIPPDFPIGAPAPYVRPTAAMCLAPTHPFVDVSTGIINTPAIVSWAFPSSKLVGVLAEMSTHFGEQSPVYARPPSHPASPSPSSPHATPAMSPYGSNYRPPAPANPAINNPYPANNGSYFPNPLRTSSSSPSLPAQQSSMYPTYPAQSPMAASHYPAAHNPYISQPPPARAAPDAGLYGAVRPPGPPAYPVGAAAGYPSAQSPLYPPPPPPKPGMSPEAAAARRSAAFRRTAIESLTKRLLASLQQSEPQVQHKAVEALEEKALLEENRKVIASACAEKKAELCVLERNVTTLSSTNAALRSWLQAQEPRAAALPAAVTPETAIVPADALCEQALAAQAEDMAIEESMEVMSDSLKAGSVTPEVYIKVCRELAEAQFKARLLGNKLQRQQHSQAAAGPPGGPVGMPGGPGMRGGVMMPQGDNWRLTATYDTPY